MNRVVFLNALPLNAINAVNFTVTIYKTPPALLRKWIEFFKMHNFKFECFIRHESTVNILNREFSLDLKPSSEQYNYTSNDRLIIVTLKTPQRGRELVVKDINDLNIYLATINVW